MKKQPKHHKDKGRCPDCLSQEPAYCNVAHNDTDEANDGLYCCMNKFHSYVEQGKKGEKG